MTPTPLTQRVDTVLDRFLREQEPLWHGPVLTALRAFILNGGKRLRPAFCYWGWRGADPADIDEATPIVAGAALELFHCFALIHDDIIDGSTRRRGEPSLHEHFIRELGGTAHLGNSIAMLCGDLCASWSDQLFNRCHVPGRRLRQAQELFARARNEAIAGEHLDVMAQTTTSGHGDTGAVSRALRVARLKTARYSIARPLQIGAALGGADRTLLSAFITVGDPLGEAFQLRDDLLGVFGDPRQTGKPVLDDLRQGKMTVLLALTYANADPVQRKTLESLVGNPTLDLAGADTIRAIMTETGARTATEHRIHRGHDLALTAIATLPVPEEVRQALTHLAALAIHRSH